VSGYYGPSGSYLYDSEEYVTLTKAAHDALAARVRGLEGALRAIAFYKRDEPFDVTHSYFAGAQDIARAALALEEPKP